MSSQIKEAFESLIERMEEPPRWEEIPEPPTASPGPPPQRWRGPLVAITAAVLTLLAFGLASLLGSDPEPADVDGWIELEPWPLERRSDFAQVWTGTELIVWGGLQEDTPNAFANGARLDPETGDWTIVADSPLSARSRHIGVWTGTEVIFWGGIEGDGDEPEFSTPLSTGAAYNPATDTWRMISDSPLTGGSWYASVWTGETVVIAGRSADEIAQYDPLTGAWAMLPPRPDSEHVPTWVSVFWTGDQVVIATTRSAFVYERGAGAWRDLGPTPYYEMSGLPVSPESPAHTFDGATVWLAGFAPQESGVVGIDVKTGEWTVSSPFPGRDCTDVPSAVITSAGPLFESCGIAAILGDDLMWNEIPPPPRTLPKHPGPNPTWIGDALIVIEAGIEPGAVNFPEGAEPHTWIYSWRDPEVTYTTYRDREGSVWIRSDCPNTDQTLFGNPDGLPMKGSTLSREEIEAMIGDDPRYRILPRNGGVWERTPDGDVVVTQAEDFLVELTLEEESQCPEAPVFVSGVPYIYRIAGD